MLISVFTPAYNRADLIHRVFDSLNRQVFTDFEWIIIDDGSTDRIAEVVKIFRSKARYPIRFYRQKNRGKARSINAGLKYAKGELFICFDSDDWCTSDAFSRIAEAWASLSLTDRNSYCGVSCLKVLADGSLVGEDYKRMLPKGESYVDRFNRRVKGDKWEVLRTDLHRSACYDLFGDEKYMAPSYAWLKMGKEYKTLFINEALSVVEYQVQGISSNNLFHRVSSPVSATRFYYLAWSISNGLFNKLRAAINYTRFCFHGKVPSRLAAPVRLVVLIPGWFVYLGDLRSLKKRAIE